MAKILGSGQDYVEGHIVETLHKFDDKLDNAFGAAQTANDALTVANAAMPRSGGDFTGAVNFATQRILQIFGDLRNTPFARFGGIYKTSDNAVVLWRNDVSGVEQKCIFPLSTFGTTKLNVINTPTPGTATGLVSLTNKVKDSGNEFNTTTMRFTATIAGDYDLSATVLKAASTETKITFRKNGMAFGVGASVSATTNNEIISLSDMISLAAGDYIDLYVSAGQIVTDFATNRLIVTTRI